MNYKHTLSFKVSSSTCPQPLSCVHFIIILHSEHRIITKSLCSAMHCLLNVFQVEVEDLYRTHSTVVGTLHRWRRHCWWTSIKTVRIWKWYWLTLEIDLIWKRTIFNVCLRMSWRQLEKWWKNRIWLIDRHHIFRSALSWITQQRATEQKLLWNAVWSRSILISKFWMLLFILLVAKEICR